MHAKVLFGFILLISTFIAGNNLLKLRVLSLQSSGGEAWGLCSVALWATWMPKPKPPFPGSSSGDSNTNMLILPFIQGHKTTPFLSWMFPKAKKHVLFSAPFTSCWKTSLLLLLWEGIIAVMPQRFSLSFFSGEEESLILSVSVGSFVFLVSVISVFYLLTSVQLG